MRTLIDDFLPQVRPGYIALFSAHWAIELTYLTAYVCQFAAFRLKPALAVRAIEPIYFLNSHIYNLHSIKYMVGHKISDITEKVYTQREFEWVKDEIEKIK